MADLSLRREKLLGTGEVRLLGLNLFNHNARELTFAAGNIPFDLPPPSRAFYAQFQYSL